MVATSQSLMQKPACEWQHLCRNYMQGAAAMCSAWPRPRYATFTTLHALEHGQHSHHRTTTQQCKECRYSKSAWGPRSLRLMFLAQGASYSLLEMELWWLHVSTTCPARSPCCWKHSNSCPELYWRRLLLGWHLEHMSPRHWGHKCCMHSNICPATEKSDSIMACFWCCKQTVQLRPAHLHNNNIGVLEAVKQLPEDELVVVGDAVVDKGLPAVALDGLYQLYVLKVPAEGQHLFQASNL